MKILFSLLILLFSLAGFAATPVDDYAPSVKADADKDTDAGPHVVSRFIPQLSLVASSHVGPDSTHSTTVGGYGLGATVDFGFSDFVIEGGLLYRTLGSKDSYDGSSISYSIGYLGIPVYAKFYFPKFDSTAIYVKAGVLPEVVVNQSVSYDNIYTTDPNAHYRYFDFDLAFGVGAKISLTPSNDLFIETVYTKGLTNVYDDTVGQTVYNAAFMLTAGFSFNL